LNLDLTTLEELSNLSKSLDLNLDLTTLEELSNLLSKSLDLTMSNLFSNQ